MSKRKKLADANGVDLRYWSYIYYVSDTSVKGFLENNGIDIVSFKNTKNGCEMAPIIFS